MEVQNTPVVVLLLIVAVGGVFFLFFLLQGDNKKRPQQESRPKKQKKQRKESVRQEKKQNKKNVLYNEKDFANRSVATEEDKANAPSQIIEFLKGQEYDSSAAPRVQRKVVKAEEEEVAELHDLISEGEEGSEEEYILIKRKKLPGKKKEKAGEKEKKPKKKIPFIKSSVIKELRAEKEDPTKEPEAETGGKRGGKKKEGETEERPQKKSDKEAPVEGEERPKRRERRQPANEENGDPQNPPRERPKRVFTAIKPVAFENYEAPSIEDALNNMTNWINDQPKPQQNRKNEKKPFPPKGEKPSKEGGKPAAKKASDKPRGPLTFLTLPKFFQIEILSKLAMKDLGRFALSSKTLSKVVQSQPLWEVLCRRDFNVVKKAKEKTWLQVYQEEWKKRNK